VRNIDVAIIINSKHLTITGRFSLWYWFHFIVYCCGIMP